VAMPVLSDFHTNGCSDGSAFDGSGSAVICLTLFITIVKDVGFTSISLTGVVSGSVDFLQFPADNMPTVINTKNNLFVFMIYLIEN
jgi:hypothetical protein